MKNIPLYEVRTIRDLKDMLNSSVQLYGDKAAFLSKPRGSQDYMPISYRQYKDDVEAFGTALSSLGLKGKRIALISENRYEWAVSYLAAVNGIGVVVPLDKELPPQEIKNLLIRSKVSAVIFSNNVSGKVLPVIPELDFIEYQILMDEGESTGSILNFHDLLSKGRNFVAGGNISFINAEIQDEAMSVLLFTSGTTEISKAVMLSHKNICSNLMAMCSMLYIGKNDVFLSILPIHHTYECTCGFLCQIYRGSTIAYCEGLRHIPRNLKESKATVMLGVPLIFEALYNRIWDHASKDPSTLKKLKTGIKISNILKYFGIDITKKLFSQIHDNFGGHIRLFISGAAGIDPVIAKGLREFGINILQGYGLTECSPIVALNRDIDFKDTAAGLPLPGLDIKIDNPNSEGIGEIVVKGPSVMLGYYENAAATEKVLKDGWFYTGDMGYMDREKFIYITGRKKNVIVTKNGKNIYPEEIETLLNRSAYIKESLVQGKEDAASGDVTVSATIVPDTEKILESLNKSELTSEEMYKLIQNEIKLVNKSLVTYKYIRDFRLREEEFVKTTTKKIKRYIEEES